MISLSLVVPLYNEENRLQTHFREIREYLATLGKEFEIILVNDGSVDKTGELVNEFVTQHGEVRSLHIPCNRGKGHAVKKGILSSRGEFIIFTDADLAVPVRFIGTCLSQLESGCPVVIGSRHLPRSCFRVRQGFMRQFFGELFRRFARVALLLKVSDITCGLKGFERRAALDVFSRSRVERWGYDAEILFLARRLGYGLTEIPVEWYHGENSKVRIGPDSVRTLAEILEIYYNFLITNRYNLRVQGRRFHGPPNPPGGPEG